jgi:hypothetical protein
MSNLISHQVELPFAIVLVLKQLDVVLGDFDQRDHDRLHPGVVQERGARMIFLDEYIEHHDVAQARLPRACASPSPRPAPAAAASRGT